MKPSRKSPSGITSTVRTCDTLLGLKSGSFSRVSASYGSRRDLVGVSTSTRTPYRVRFTMLDDPRHSQLPRLAVQVQREDIGLADHISVSAETTGRTVVVASPGFMPITALWTGLT